MVERDRERRQKEFDKKVKSNSDLFNEDTDSESENFEPRKIKYKSRKTLESSDSEGRGYEGNSFTSFLGELMHVDPLCNSYIVMHIL